MWTFLEEVWVLYAKCNYLWWCSAHARDKSCRHHLNFTEVIKSNCSRFCSNQKNLYKKYTLDPHLIKYSSWRNVYFALSAKQAKPRLDQPETLGRWRLLSTVHCIVVWWIFIHCALYCVVWWISVQCAVGDCAEIGWGVQQGLSGKWEQLIHQTGQKAPTDPTAV